VRQELPGVHASLRVTDVTTQSALVGNTLLRERLLAVLSGFFAALGLVLAAVGLYGMLSYAVVRRTREIGIRLTLGAQPAAVVRAVIGRVAIAMGLGVVAGLAAERISRRSSARCSTRSNRSRRRVSSCRCWACWERECSRHGSRRAGRPASIPPRLSGWSDNRSSLIPNRESLIAIPNHYP
jgi:hypothetical protein